MVKGEAYGVWMVVLFILYEESVFHFFHFSFFLIKNFFKKKKPSLYLLCSLDIFKAVVTWAFLERHYERGYGNFLGVSRIFSDFLFLVCLCGHSKGGVMREREMETDIW